MKNMVGWGWGFGGADGGTTRVWMQYHVRDTLSTLNTIMAGRLGGWEEVGPLGFYIEDNGRRAVMRRVLRVLRCGAHWVVDLLI